MNSVVTTKSIDILGDIITPVQLYLKLRDRYLGAVLLESSDYHTTDKSFSFIGLNPIAEFIVEDGQTREVYPNKTTKTYTLQGTQISEKLNAFISSFECVDPKNQKQIGFFGYSTFDAVNYFENIKLNNPKKKSYKIPDVRYTFYKHVIVFHHYHNQIKLYENYAGDDRESILQEIEDVVRNKNFSVFEFDTVGKECSNLEDQEFKDMVKKGKEACFRGDVFQIVLARQFRQKFKGDEFNVYRALRCINPSPYLFYFDYGNYKIFGSSPEAQLIIQDNIAVIDPIAGTFKRTGDDDKDRALAIELSRDEKENAEHVMLVDLARNDLSRNSFKVEVERYKEVQYFSHVLHMVSRVKAGIESNVNTIKVFADSFPAGTLSGAPKYKAMQLIDKMENQSRGFYGGAIGFLGLTGDVNQAIIIRSFLSKDNVLYYQAGAGVVSASKEENELQEVNNKLAALKKAVELAKNIKR